MKDEKQKGCACGRKELVIKKYLSLKPSLCKETEDKLGAMRGEFRQGQEGALPQCRELYI